MGLILDGNFYGISQLDRFRGSVEVFRTAEVHHGTESQFRTQFLIPLGDLRTCASIDGSGIDQFLGEVFHILLQCQEAEHVQRQNDDHHGCHDEDDGIDI